MHNKIWSYRYFLSTVFLEGKSSFSLRLICFQTVMPFVLSIRMSSRIAKREHGLKLQLIRMHAQYMNLKVNQVHFCFILQANPKTRGYLWFCTECDESVSVENFGLHKEEYFVRYLLGVGGGGVLSCICLIGMCHSKGLGFYAVLV